MWVLKERGRKAAVEEHKPGDQAAFSCLNKKFAFKPSEGDWGAVRVCSDPHEKRTMQWGPLRLLSWVFGISLKTTREKAPPNSWGRGRAKDQTLPPGAGSSCLSKEVSLVLQNGELQAKTIPETCKGKVPAFRNGKKTVFGR